MRQLRHGLCGCAIQRVNGQDLSAFERGMVVGARRTCLCQELQRCWDFLSEDTVSAIQYGKIQCMITIQMEDE